MKKILKKILNTLVPELKIIYPCSAVEFLDKSQLTYSNDLLWTYNNADFMAEPKFAESYALCKQVDGGRLLSNYDIQWRVFVLCWAANQVKNLDGAFVDCGVHTGMCARAVMHYIDFKTLPKKYYLFDTFCGMDPRYSSDSEMERHEKLGYAEQHDMYEKVQQTFSGFNVQIIKGTVPDTLDQFDSEHVSYLSIDMNCVQPEVAALEFFWDKMLPGGIIILDDYGYPGAMDQKLAHDAFAASKGAMILGLPTCQGLILKS